MIQKPFHRINTRYLLYLLVSLMLSGCEQDEIQLGKLTDDAVIVAFGDSLTYGTGAKPDESYPVILEQLTGRTVINAGISGELSATGLARFKSILDKHQPDLIIICHGGNDILRKKNLSETKDNIISMIRMAKTSGIDLVLLGVPRPGIFLESATFYQEIADEQKIVFYKNLIAEILSDSKLKSDTVHPNNKGYKIMANNIYQLLKSAGAI